MFPLKNFNVYEREASDDVSTAYVALDNAIAECGECYALHIDAQFTLIDKHRWYEYLHDLKLTDPIEVFCYS